MDSFTKKLRTIERTLSKKDPVLKKIITNAGPCTLTLPKRFSPYESLIESITHQQLHGKAAQTIFRRFKELFPQERFPSAESVIKAKKVKLRSAGLSEAKVLAIQDVAAKKIDGTIPTNAMLTKLSDEEIIERLTSIRGVGRWTVEMMLMFKLGRLDVLPVDDFGVCNGFSIAYRCEPDKKLLKKRAELWQPYCSIASWYMWRAVDLSRAK